MDAISDKISDITNVKLSDTQLATVLTSLVELKEIVPGYPVQSPSEDVNLEADLLRHCGIQPDDDWVKRVERLNGIIDVMREERGEVVA